MFGKIVKLVGDDVVACFLAYILHSMVQDHVAAELCPMIKRQKVIAVTIMRQRNNK